MTITIDMSDFSKLAALTAKMRPAGRAQLNRVGVYAAMANVKRHIHGYAMGKHFSATRIGAAPTGHYEKGAAAISANSGSDHAEIIIPIPGIGLAYHDIRVTAPTRNGKRFVTIPKHEAAYGHTVDELRARGWKIFRPGEKKCLLGYRKKGDKPTMLYALADDVRKRQDPRLLPSRQELGRIFATAQADEIRRVMRKAGR